MARKRPCCHRDGSEVASPRASRPAVQEIEERYARPLHELEKDVETFSAKVNRHLARMGLTL